MNTTLTPLALRDLVLARLRAVPNLGVHEGPADDVDVDAWGAVRPFVVLWTGPGATSFDTLAGRPTGTDHTFTVHAAGVDTEACLAAAQAARDALNGHRVPGAGLIQEVPVTGLIPTPEVGVSPHRVSVPVLFTVTS